MENSKPNVTQSILESNGHKFAFTITIHDNTVELDATHLETNAVFAESLSLQVFRSRITNTSDFLNAITSKNIQVDWQQVRKENCANDHFLQDSKKIILRSGFISLFELSETVRKDNLLMHLQAQIISMKEEISYLRQQAEWSGIIFFQPIPLQQTKEGVSYNGSCRGPFTGEIDLTPISKGQATYVVIHASTKCRRCSVECRQYGKNDVYVAILPNKRETGMAHVSRHYLPLVATQKVEYRACYTHVEYVNSVQKTISCDECYFALVGYGF